MKLSKEDEWRISGMQYALKIAKKDGMKGLKMDMPGHNYGNMKPYNMLERFRMMFLHCWKYRVNMYFE